MAELLNIPRSLRFVLALADREVLPQVPGQPRPDPKAGRLLAMAAVECFDRRDQAYWPMVRLGVVWLAPGDGPALLEGLGRLVRGEVPGMGFRSGGAQDLFLQLGKAAEPEAGYLVEVGLDLHHLLGDASGLPAEPGRDLALFRFCTTQAQLVAFADQLRGELEALSRADSPLPP